MSPATALRAAREERLAEWFRGRRWRVMAEIDGVRIWPLGASAEAPDAVPVRFSRGSFVIDSLGFYASPLGHPGRKGVLLREIDSEGNDLAATTCWGLGTLKSAVRDYEADISGLPAK